MSLGNDHNVDLGLRSRVMKSQHAVVFPDLYDLDFAGENILTVPVATCHVPIAFLQKPRLFVPVLSGALAA